MKEKNRRMDQKEARRAAYIEAVSDLLDDPTVLKMAQFRQHAHISCLEHCMFVSYVSFCLARFFRCDSKSAARGGLLHDLFLYDWHDRYGHCRPHLSHHPKVAYRNASKVCELNDIEKDCILKHMWPMANGRPRFLESVIVNVSDDVCAIAEVLQIYKMMRMKKRLFAYC